MGVFLLYDSSGINYTEASISMQVFGPTARRRSDSLLVIHTHTHMLPDVTNVRLAYSSTPDGG